MKLQVGTRYRFRVSQTAKNSSGVTWTATATNLDSGKATRIGSLYWDESAAGVPLGGISNAPIAFQEYCEDTIPSIPLHATWSRPIHSCY